MKWRRTPCACLGKKQFRHRKWQGQKPSSAWRAAKGQWSQVRMKGEERRQDIMADKEWGQVIDGLTGHGGLQLFMRWGQSHWGIFRKELMGYKWGFITKRDKGTLVRATDTVIIQAKGNGHFSRSDKVEVTGSQESRRIASVCISSCKMNCEVRANRERILNFFLIFSSPDTLCMVIQ